MQYSLLFPLIVSLILLLPACTPHYQLARSEMPQPWMEKPVRTSRDTLITGNYFSASHSHKLDEPRSTDPDFEHNRQFEAGFNRAWVFPKNIFVAAGLRAYGGTYRITQSTLGVRRETFYGIGLTAESGIDLLIDRITYRPFIVQASIFREFGGFSRFRALPGKGASNLHPDDLVVMLGMSTELAIPIQQSLLSLQLGSGIMSYREPFTRENRMDALYLQAGLRLQHDPFSLFVQLGTSSFIDNYTITLGAGWRFGK